MSAPTRVANERPVRGDVLEPADSPGFLLWRATLRWQRLMAETLRPLGLTHVQFVLLASLWWLASVEREAPTQRGLAEFAGTDPMMTSQVVRSLEARALIDRFPHPTDARARRLSVTPRGAALAQEAIHAVEAADRTFFAPATGRRTATELLRILAG
jgi:DNA-binding MarR family transcriptional regulator